MKTIAIITARGGSKRIPKKNIRDFNGKPILAYSVQAAIESGCFGKVMVSTDSEEIAQAACSCGADVPFLRSEETSNDFATSADVIREVLARYEEMGEHFDAFMCIYPTAPFLTGKILREAFAALGDHDALIPVVRFSFPPQRAFVVRDGQIAYRWPEHRNTRSQDLEPFYHDAGQFYLVRCAAFERENTLVPQDTAPLILPEILVQDIDNEEDWRIAEVKYNVLHQG